MTDKPAFIENVRKICPDVYIDFIGKYYDVLLQDNAYKGILLDDCCKWLGYSRVRNIRETLLKSKNDFVEGVDYDVVQNGKCKTYTLSKNAFTRLTYLSTKLVAIQFAKNKEKIEQYFEQITQKIREDKHAPKQAEQNIVQNMPVIKKKEHVIYLIHINDDLYKYGLTTHFNRRMRSHMITFNFESVVDTWKLENASQLKIVEDKIKRHAMCLDCKIEYRGQTEIIQTDDINKFVQIIGACVKTEILKESQKFKDYKHQRDVEFVTLTNVNKTLEFKIAKMQNDHNAMLDLIREGFHKPMPIKQNLPKDAFFAKYAKYISDDIKINIELQNVLKLIGYDNIDNAIYYVKKYGTDNVDYIINDKTMHVSPKCVRTLAVQNNTKFGKNLTKYIDEDTDDIDYDALYSNEEQQIFDEYESKGWAMCQKQECGIWKHVDFFKSNKAYNTECKWCDVCRGKDIAKKDNPKAKERIKTYNSMHRQQNEEHMKQCDAIRRIIHRYAINKRCRDDRRNNPEKYAAHERKRQEKHGARRALEKKIKHNSNPIPGNLSCRKYNANNPETIGARKAIKYQEFLAMCLTLDPNIERGCNGCKKVHPTIKFAHPTKIGRYFKSCNACRTSDALKNSNGKKFNEENSNATEKYCTGCKHMQLNATFKDLAGRDFNTCETCRAKNKNRQPKQK